MPSINPELVPTIAPGNIFERFTTDTTLNIQWLTPSDPVLFEALNRPIADVTLRQLIIAKALDNIELRLGHITLFPFLVPPKLVVGSGEVDLPTAWLWDMHVSLPAKWEYLRLAKVKRISGVNNGGSGTDITGTLRLVFSAQEQGSGIEVYLFYVDYRIDSDLNYQIVRIVPCTADEETNPIDPAETETINGFVYFRTLNTEDATNRAFFLQVAPPSGVTDSNSDGIYDNPAVYEVAASVAGTSAASEDFLASSLSHGTGITVASAWNAIPALDSDFASWLKSSNYPFGIGATRVSIEGITIPQALFNEFNVVVPAPDEPTGAASLNYNPVWISRIERVDTLATELRVILATYTILDDGALPEVIEFAAFTLKRDYTSGRIVSIEPADDLLKATGTDKANFMQGFGLGHVVLGSVWGSTTTTISDFFDSFLALVTTSEATFTQPNARLSSYSLARSSRYIPTKGQFDALKGSTARLSTPRNPSDSNRYITEADQGLGDAIDFRTKTGFTENQDIEPIGYTGSLAHRIVSLEVESEGTSHTYETDVLPRLRCLFGRDPIFGDVWYDGTIFKMYNGDTWLEI
jgi:hypothetical protein